MPHRAPAYAIILAGGKGTRMRSEDCHKVCFPIAGRPAILRAMDTFSKCGVGKAVIVVGAMAEQVMSTVASEYPEALYTYQPLQQGTGDAARRGVGALVDIAPDADVLLVAGDRIVEPMVLEQLFDLYYEEACDLAFLVAPKAPRSGQGRVVFDARGNVLGDVEVCDIAHRRALSSIRGRAKAGDPPCASEALETMTADVGEERAAVAFGDLWAALQDLPADSMLSDTWWLDRIPVEKAEFAFAGPSGSTVLSPRQVEATDWVNASVYLLKPRVLHDALSRLTRDNAQREEYLSDVINILAAGLDSSGSSRRVRALKVADPHHVMAYNNPAELLAIEAYYQQRASAKPAPVLGPLPWYRSIESWRVDIGAVLAGANDVASEWRETYGDQADLIGERQSAYAEVLNRAEEMLGPETRVFLVRSPGRVNILGRHIDHQGGNCNLMGIDREIIMAVHPRDDDWVTLHNVAEGQFGERRFSIADMLAQLPWDDWMSLVDSEPVRAMVVDASGDWSQYVRAAVLRLQKQFATAKLRGMDLIVHGNIPIAAGLSSSSAMVVASAQATVACNELTVRPSQFVDLCGQGEWFVGTRGGSADHAAMVFAQKGKVAQVRFFEFGVEQMVAFPEDYALVICNSGIQARKAAGARDVFNHRIACYHLGFALIKARYPQYAPLLQHLRDVNVRRLGIPLMWIYRILLSLPEKATVAELAELLPRETLTPIMATHAPAGDYPIRGVVMFGLAESERSRAAADLLRECRVAEFGRLMTVSHDGDRVTCHDERGDPMPYRYRVSNAYLLDLMADLESGDPERVISAQIEWQPGAYRCSTPEIDLMVDTALSVPGVVGAQLAGAGLGGCMMILAHHRAIGDLERAMIARYYEPRNLGPEMSVCSPIAGSSVLLRH